MSRLDLIKTDAIELIHGQHYHDSQEEMEGKHKECRRPSINESCTL